MFRAILPDGILSCAYFERTDHGVELYNEEGDLKAFVPYANLIAMMNEEIETEEDRSIF